ncbi:hypothetical protein OA503_06335 [Prochlorococcus sp. AH-716-K03]|jgi:hypothetical protein|nr:hypothetical protein [Prochlorococcus sp. AH-716-K03]|tara:strand:+ start:536 stop:820 length:285 start_codon:yes stop_codon:yes gene_type:complete
MDTIKLLERRINLLEKRLDSLLNHEDDATKLEWLTTTELGKQVNRDGRTILKWINKGKFSPDLLKKIHHGNKRFIYRLKNPEAVEKAKNILMGL